MAYHTSLAAHYIGAGDIAMQEDAMPPFDFTSNTAIPLPPFASFVWISQAGSPANASAHALTESSRIDGNDQVDGALQGSQANLQKCRS